MFLKSADISDSVYKHTQYHLLCTCMHIYILIGIVYVGVIIQKLAAMINYIWLSELSGLVGQL